MISGYERNVEEARQAIQQLVAELQEMVSQDVHLDPRTHARIIGARGKAIRKLMEEFKVLQFGVLHLCSVDCVLCSCSLNIILFMCAGGYPVPSAGLRRAGQSDGDGAS